MPRPRTPATGLLRPAIWSVLCCASLTVSAGCSSGTDEPGPQGPSATAATSPEAPAVPTDAKIGVVRGELSRSARQSVVAEVQAAFDSWVDAAFLGTYPRTDFDDAYPGFAREVAARARKEGLMSNESLGADLASATPVLRRVRVDTLAVKGRPATATARFTLVEDLVGTDLEQRDRLDGSLFLTRAGGAWQVFGYDVDRGTR